MSYESLRNYRVQIADVIKNIPLEMENTCSPNRSQQQSLVQRTASVAEANKCTQALSVFCITEAQKTLYIPLKIPRISIASAALKSGKFDRRYDLPVWKTEHSAYRAAYILLGLNKGDNDYLFMRPTNRPHDPETNKLFKNIDILTDVVFNCNRGLSATSCPTG